MNFFVQQDRARRNTFWLIVLMLLAVICLIGVTAITVGMGLYFIQQPTDSPRLVSALNTPFSQHFVNILFSDLIYYAAATVLAVVVCGSAYKFFQLGGSGRKVAEALGGRPILANTQDLDERKLLNVVEEMALASGNPVPLLYVLDEPGINAFAAGHDRRSAVIGVTRGCLQHLSRDQLQGVIAHEFSHILNGDMRINLRLIAILHGILVIGLIGSYLLRSSAYSNRNKNRGAQLGAGLALLILGYCGVFFGNLIKAAVSRQREFLADASAVQFTRNPSGIAGALKKIGGLQQHALLTAANANEYSHLFFGQSVNHWLGGLMATHPPLHERIRRIEPGWNGQLATQASTARPTSASATEATMGFTTTATIDSIGNPKQENISHAQQVISGIPSIIYQAAHDSFSARALVYGLLMDTSSPTTLAQQQQLLQRNAHPATFKAYRALAETLTTLPRSHYLALVELTMPALKAQSQAQYKVFKSTLALLIKADQQVSLLEWCYYQIITLGYEETKVRGHLNLSQLSTEVNLLVNLMVHCGNNRHPSTAFAAAAKALPEVTLHQQNAAQITFQDVDRGLLKLAQLKPFDKPKLLKAIAACIESDGRILPQEAELFRVVADALNCPVPMLTPS